MKVKDFYAPGLTLHRLDRPARRSSDQPGLKAALLGLVCVVGVFGMLGLLYSIG